MRNRRRDQVMSARGIQARFDTGHCHSIALLNFGLWLDIWSWLYCHENQQEFSLIFVGLEVMRNLEITWNLASLHWLAWRSRIQKRRIPKCLLLPLDPLAGQIWLNSDIVTQRKYDVCKIYFFIHTFIMYNYISFKRKEF